MSNSYRPLLNGSSRLSTTSWYSLVFSHLWPLVIQFVTFVFSGFSYWLSIIPNQNPNLLMFVYCYLIPSLIWKLLVFRFSLSLGFKSCCESTVIERRTPCSSGFHQRGTIPRLLHRLGLIRHRISFTIAVFLGLQTIPWRPLTSTPPSWIRKGNRGRWGDNLNRSKSTRLPGKAIPEAYVVSSLCYVRVCVHIDRNNRMDCTCVCWLLPRQIQ